MISDTRTWSNFDIDTYIKNGQAIANVINEGVKVFSMENADAYSYMPYIDSPMKGLCPNYLAVDKIEDAALIRKMGNNMPILVLDQFVGDDGSEYIKLLHRNYLAQSIESMERLQALQGKVMIYGGVLKVHLKLEIGDKGTGFKYFNEEDTLDDLIAAVSLTGTYCEGIFTELSAGDPVDAREKKIQSFLKVADKVEHITGKKFALKHFFIK